MPWYNLFNRFAQAAGPGLNAPSDEGKKGMKGWRGGSMKGWGKKTWKDEGANGWKDEGKNGWMGAGRKEKWIKGSRDEGRNEGSRDEGRNVWKEEGENRYMDVGRKGRTKAWKEGGIDPTSERKGAEKSNIDPRIYKKRVPKSTKMVPKSTQKGPKTKPRQTTNQSNVFKTILDPSGGRFPGYRTVVREPFGVQNRGKIRKKTDAKDRWFFDRPWKPNKLEKGSQNHSKMKPKLVQHRTQKEAQEKNGKSVKTNNTTRF